MGPLTTTFRFPEALSGVTKTSDERTSSDHHIELELKWLNNLKWCASCGAKQAVETSLHITPAWKPHTSFELKILDYLLLVKFLLPQYITQRETRKRIHSIWIMNRKVICHFRAAPRFRLDLPVLTPFWQLIPVTLLHTNAFLLCKAETMMNEQTETWKAFTYVQHLIEII